ncbi:MAG: OmpA family protein [Bacteroidota bacterium]
MKKRILHISLFLIVLLVGSVQAQTPKPISKNLISLRSLAEKEFRASQYETAIALYQSYFKKINFTDTVALYNVAESYRLSRQYDSAIAVFARLSNLQPKYLPNLAELYATKGDYGKAVQVYKSIQTADTVLIKKIEARLIGFKGKEDFELDSLDWKIIRSEINSDGNESSPMRYRDGIFYISSPVGKSGSASNIGAPQLLFAPDSMVLKEKRVIIDSSSKKKIVQKKSRKIPVDISARNSIDNNTLRKPIRRPSSAISKESNLLDPFLQQLIKAGPIHLTVTGDTVFYSNTVKQKNKFTKLGIFYAVKKSDSWKEFPEITAGFQANAFHPAVSANGKKIYFVSDVKGGLGGPDIYYIDRLGDTAWSKPENAGDLINTAGNELYPSLIGDSLYFSSNGRGGLGGQDVFAVKVGSNEHPVNLGYPINSSYDDYGFIFNSDRTGGFVTTNRSGSNDIYAFNFKKVFYRVGGSINYASDNTIAKQETIYLVDSKTNQSVDSTTTDDLGNYYFNLRPNRIYRIEQRENGLPKGSYVVNTKEPVRIDSNLLVKRIQADAPVVAVKDLLVDTASIAILQRIADIDSLVALEKSINSIKSSIQKLQKDSSLLAQAPLTGDDGTLDSLTLKKVLIQSQLRELTSDLTRTSYKKLELSYMLQPPKEVVAINSTQAIEKIKINIQLPGVSPKQRADSIAFVRQQQMIKLKMEEELLLRGDQLTRFNVYFGFSKSTLNLIEQKILDSTIRVLKANPKLFAVMGSFTDCSGPIDFNMQLSARRSAAVIKYLTKNGIDKSRIRENHYGKNYLVQNCSPKRYSSRQQLLNRRTEIYLTDDRSLAWTDLAADTTKKYTVYTALGKKLSDFVSLKTVYVTAKKLTVDSSRLTVKRAVDSSQLTVKRQQQIVKKDTSASVVKKVLDVKKDSVVIVKAQPSPVNRQQKSVDSSQLTVKRAPVVVKQDTLAIAKAQPKTVLQQPMTKNLQPTTVKQDSVVIVKAQPSTVNRQQKSVDSSQLTVKRATVNAKVDTVAIAKTQSSTVNRQQKSADSSELTVKRATVNAKIDTVTIAKVQPKPASQQPTTNKLKPAVVKEDTVAIAKAQPKIQTPKPSTPPQPKQLTPEEEDRITREELLAALDSLAKLRREQERIVEYLTKRINKKPIEVFTYADSVTVEIFDSGIHDKDSVSVIFNKTLVVDKHELKVDRPIKFKVRVDKDRRNNEMVIVAENLGTYPPNTAVMIITDKFGKHEEIMLSTDLTTNEVVIFIRIDKQPESNPAKNQP